MKKSTTSLLLFLSTIVISAQPAMNPGGEGKTLTAERKFQILVENEKNQRELENNNKNIKDVKKKTKAMAEGSEKGLFLELLKSGYGSALTQNTVNATSNVLSLGISYLTEAFKSHQSEWYCAAQQQCVYKKSLKSETKIDDFYALPSAVGAMDPMNLKFKGFGCRHYLEVKDRPGEGKEVFFLFCKLRTDSIGIAHIVNHSKFLVEIDSLMFNPTYCNLPNDSTGSVNSRFDFDKRKDLTFKVTVKVYSSWINEAILVTSDQLLGEFVIMAKIDKDVMKDSMFVYDKHDPRFEKLVNISGDSFVVPRSFSGTNDGKTYARSWGTGQYRLEMEIEENCKINDEYYLIRQSGNPEKTAFANGTPGKRKWDKEKWKTEWTAMKARKKGTSFLRNAWDGIVTAYKGSGWVETFTDPLSTVIYNYETERLNDWLNLTTTETTGSAAGMAGPSATTGAAGGASASAVIMQQGGNAQGGDELGSAPQGGMPPTSGQPTGNK